MKVTLDLDQLLKDEKITPVEYDRLKEMATQATHLVSISKLCSSDDVRWVMVTDS